MYIRATGNVSPQNTFGFTGTRVKPVEYTGNRLSCIEPDYKEFIDVKLIRRMSRIIKMGVAAASECLRAAGDAVPDAIITGTAYGCLEDTGTFLKKMVENNEELLTPTAFIQSTHNTVGAQIGLMLKCHAYNNTFVHRGFSFESALLDAIMLLKENQASNVLVGSADEITDISHAILQRFGLYKASPVSNLQLFDQGSKGTIAGEGAAFFLLSRESSGNDYAFIDGSYTFYKPGGLAETQEHISVFLKEHSLDMHDIGLVITGRNGDKRGDGVYDHLDHTIFKDKETINYKHYCGEYPTSVSFAMWLAASYLKTGEFPLETGGDHQPVSRPSKILIYNHYQDIHHSLLLLSAC